jgi:hypothetical protein
VPSAAAWCGQAPVEGPLRAVLDPLIVIKKHHSSLLGNTFNLTSASAALLHHLFTCRAMGESHHADRLDTAGMGRNTCANQRSHLRLQSSAF